jgi:RNA polymerase sigma-70 factor (ECF subfamily)
LLRDRAAAEDATQETFVRVQRHLASVPPGSNQALAWIYRVATNYCLNELRNRGRRAELHAELPEPARDPDRDRLDHGEEVLANRDLAMRLIDHIPSKLRAIAWLYHVDGLDQQEIAEVLGLSRRTVTTRLAKFSASARKLMLRFA